MTFYIISSFFEKKRFCFRFVSFLKENTFFVAFTPQGTGPRFGCEAMPRRTFRRKGLQGQDGRPLFSCALPSETARSPPSILQFHERRLMNALFVSTAKRRPGERTPSLLFLPMVGARGFEPPTSWSRTKRANQAALRPERFLSGSRVGRHHTPAPHHVRNEGNFNTFPSSRQTRHKERS